MWQSIDGIFLGQGMYAVEILKRFRMMDCMTTPIASNLKLLSDASSETIDAAMYRQMIGQAVPSIGRVLQDVASVWDQV